MWKCIGFNSFVCSFRFWSIFFSVLDDLFYGFAVSTRPQSFIRNMASFRLGWISRLWFYCGSADFSCYSQPAAYFILSQSALFLSHRALQADLKDNDLWKPNSSRETYEHIHHMKASAVAVHEYTPSPEVCSLSIPSFNYLNKNHRLRHQGD